MIGHRTVCYVQFNRNVIRSKWSKMNKGPIAMAGLRVMRYARNSIRRGTVSKAGLRKPSKPGRPPKSWQPGATPPMKMIFSVPDQMGTRTLVGFVGFGASMPVPAIHEHGKTVMRRVFRPVPPGRTGKHGQKLKDRMKPIRAMVNYPKRETMLPALVRAAPRLPSLWQGSLHE